MSNDTTLTAEQLAEYKALKARAELKHSYSVNAYKVRKLTRATHKAYFEKHATNAEKQALQRAIEAL